MMFRLCNSIHGDAHRAANTVFHDRHVICEASAPIVQMCVLITHGPRGNRSPLCSQKNRCVSVCCQAPLTTLYRPLLLTDFSRDTTLKALLCINTPPPLE